MKTFKQFQKDYSSVYVNEKKEPQLPKKNNVKSMNQVKVTPGKTYNPKERGILNRILGGIDTSREDKLGKNIVNQAKKSKNSASFRAFRDVIKGTAPRKGLAKLAAGAAKGLAKTPKGALVAGGLVAAVAGARAIKNLVNRGYSSDKGVYKGGYGKGNKGLPPGSEGKPTHKMKQMFIKGVPKARVDKKGSAQVSKPKEGSWNDRQLKMTNEGATVIPAAVAASKYVVPALMTGIGAAGTIMQSKKKDKDVNITPRGLKNLENAVFRGKTGRKLDGEILKRREQKKAMKGPFADTPSAEELRKAKLTGQLIKPKQGEVEKTKELIDKYKKTSKTIKPKEGEITKQKELIRKAEKEITKPKKGEKKEASKTLKDFLKARKIEGRTMMKIKQDTDISKKGPGDQLPDARRDYLNKLLKNLRKEEVAIANSMGGGGIAGSVEAGDEPPVKKNKRGSGMKNRKKKKKTYAYGGRGSRKMWMT